MKFGKLKSTKVSKGNKYADGVDGIDPKQKAAKEKAKKQTKEQNRTLTKEGDENLTGSGVTREITPAKSGTPPSREYKGEKITGFKKERQYTGNSSYGKETKGNELERMSDEELEKAVKIKRKGADVEDVTRKGERSSYENVNKEKGKVISKQELDKYKQKYESANLNNKPYALGKVEHESVYEDKPGTEPTPEKKQLKTTASEIYKTKAAPDIPTKQKLRDKINKGNASEEEKKQYSEMGLIGTGSFKNRKSLGTVTTEETQFDRKGTTNTGEKYKASNLDIQPKWRRKLIKKS